MLELCGSGYVMDYCMSAFRIMDEEKAWKNYIADGLFALVNHTMSYKQRFSDLLEEAKAEAHAEENQKSNEEEADRITNRLIDKLRGD